MAVLALLLALSGTAAAKPARIVSLNVCVDQLLLQLADRDRIVSLTQHATDPDFSNMTQAARGFSINRGRAEEVLAYRPDLVIGGEYTTGPTLQLLRRLGIPVRTLPFANSLDDVAANIRRVAGWIGEDARGEALAAAFEDKRERLREAAAGARMPLLALYQSRGYTALPGTLADDVIRTAGFANFAAHIGLGGSGRLTLEHLLLGGFAALLVADIRGQPFSLEVETLGHPVLQQVLARAPHAAIPSRLWICDTPDVLEAVEQLVALRRRVASAAQQ
jgi:iron complex transport system substrate-binding protein